MNELSLNIKKLEYENASSIIANYAFDLIKMNIKLFEHIYLIGIGGIGMSALARFFLSQNKKVYGYDKLKTNLTSDLEKNQGIEITYDDNVDNLPSKFTEEKDNRLVIYSSAISKNNIFSFFNERGFSYL